MIRNIFHSVPFLVLFTIYIHRISNTNSLTKCNALSVDALLSVPKPPRKSAVTLSASASAPAVSFPASMSPPLPKKGKTAIILNTNARSVSGDLVPIAQAVFGSENVFCTSTEEEGKRAASAIIQKKDEYSVVVPVGGDGTLASMINFMCDEIMSSNSDGESTALGLNDAMKQLPLVGYIPLGTGNGVGSVVGCQVNKIFPILPGAKRRKIRKIQYIMECLKQVAKGTNENEYEIITVPMIEVTGDIDDEILNDAATMTHKERKGDLCFFAGVGFDSLMLSDFKRIKAWSTRTGFLPRTLSSVTGYCVALVVKTLPKCVLYGRHKIRVKVSTRDQDTLWVDHRRGDFVQRCVDPTVDGMDNSLLYAGTTGILAAGTSPYYGGGLRLFPFARLTTDKMHLRIGRINPLKGFINIPNIFAGSYRDKSSDKFGCLDFIGRDFEVEVTSEESAIHNDDDDDNDTNATIKVDDDGEGRKKGYPLQHSGESVGHTERFRLRVVEDPVRFVSFSKKRVVDDR